LPLVGQQMEPHYVGHHAKAADFVKRDKG